LFKREKRANMHIRVFVIVRIVLTKLKKIMEVILLYIVM